ncbi:hypothetical protein MRB53_015207 [Persea americana]|uniref:Uncharacterized protein n=1 Tax=Persea americana TaxID=3435 RepID=A0ACC2KD58_PERAE|nr:hypothetical protein MRB53_015207 [Persea americana]
MLTYLHPLLKSSLSGQDLSDFHSNCTTTAGADFPHRLNRQDDLSISRTGDCISSRHQAPRLVGDRTYNSVVGALESHQHQHSLPKLLTIPRLVVASTILKSKELIEQMVGGDIDMGPVISGGSTFSQLDKNSFY